MKRAPDEECECRADELEILTQAKMVLGDPKLKSRPMLPELLTILYFDGTPVDYSAAL